MDFEEKNWKVLCPFHRIFLEQSGFEGCFWAVCGCFTEEMGVLYMFFTVRPNFSLINGLYAGNMWLFYGYFTF